MAEERVAIGIGAVALVAIGFAVTWMLQSHRDSAPVATKPAAPQTQPAPVAIVASAPVAVPASTVDASLAATSLDAVASIDATIAPADAAPPTAPTPPVQKKPPVRKKPIRTPAPPTRSKMDRPRPLTE